MFSRMRKPWHQQLLNPSLPEPKVINNHCLLHCFWFVSAFEKGRQLRSTTLEMFERHLLWIHLSPSKRLMNGVSQRILKYLLRVVNLKLVVSHCLICCISMCSPWVVHVAVFKKKLISKIYWSGRPFTYISACGNKFYHHVQICWYWQTCRCICSNNLQNMVLEIGFCHWLYM